MLSSVAALASTTTIAGPSIAPHIDEANRTAALDPIFAAIEIHRAAVRAYSDAVSLESHTEDTPGVQERPKLIDGMEARIKSALAAGEHSDEQDKMFQGVIAKAMKNDGKRFSANTYTRVAAVDLVRGACPDLFAKRPDEEAALRAARARTAEAHAAMEDAALAMIDRPPATLAGVIALLTYVAHHGAADGAGFPEGLDDENGEPATALGGPVDFHCLVHRCAVDALTEIAAQTAAAEGVR
jgi:putative ubiquitin-RnfH superfamily antitoxin RatB of RatAB toxin-antitoxin module